MEEISRKIKPNQNFLRQEFEHASIMKVEVLLACPALLHAIFVPGK